MRNIKGGALLYFHSPHDSYSGPHLHIVVVLHPPPPPLPLLRSKPRPPITALREHQWESMGDYEEVKARRPSGLSVWRYVGGGVAEGFLR